MVLSFAISVYRHSLVLHLAVTTQPSSLVSLRVFTGLILSFTAALVAFCLTPNARPVSLLARPTRRRTFLWPAPVMSTYYGGSVTVTSLPTMFMATRERRAMSVLTLHEGASSPRRTFLFSGLKEVSLLNAFMMFPTVSPKSLQFCILWLFSPSWDSFLVPFSCILDVFVRCFPFSPSSQASSGAHSSCCREACAAAPLSRWQRT